MCSSFYKFVCELTLDFEGMEQTVMAIDFKERILRLRGEYVILDKDVTVHPGTKLIGTPTKPIIIKRGETV